MKYLLLALILTLSSCTLITPYGEINYDKEGGNVSVKPKPFVIPTK